MTRSLLLLTSAACALIIPSCGLLQSVARVPVSLLRTVGRTAGVSRLSDHPEPAAQKAEALKNEQKSTAADSE